MAIDGPTVIVVGAGYEEPLLPAARQAWRAPVIVDEPWRERPHAGQAVSG
jgi:hypothetical protein